MEITIRQEVSPFQSRAITLSEGVLRVKELLPEGRTLFSGGSADPCYEIPLNDITQVTIFYQSNRMIRRARRLGLAPASGETEEASQYARVRIGYCRSDREHILQIEGTSVCSLERIGEPSQSSSWTTGWDRLAEFTDSLTTLVPSRIVVRKKWTL